jgi:hypothetical protein
MRTISLAVYWLHRAVAFRARHHAPIANSRAATAIAHEVTFAQNMKV